MGDANDFLLKQKVEFLESELKEVKKKEKNQSKVNQSLLLILATNEDNLLKTQVVNELGKTIEQQRKEILDLKIRHKDEVLILINEKNELILEKKDIEHKLKQQRLEFETEKIEMHSKLRRIESEKKNIENTLKSNEKNINYQQSLVQYQSDCKILDLKKELELITQEHNSEILRNRQEADKTLLEFKILYERELDSFKYQINQLNTKLKKKNREFEIAKEQSNSNLLKIQIEELESQLEYYRQSSNTRSKPLEDFNLICAETLESQGSIKYNSALFSQPQAEPKPNINQLDQALSEIKALKKEIENIKQEKNSNEKKFRDEIKYLIGKLLKAKSKLTTEGELSLNIRRESLLRTLRQGSINRPS